MRCLGDGYLFRCFLSTSPVVYKGRPGTRPRFFAGFGAAFPFFSLSPFFPQECCCPVGRNVPGCCFLSLAWPTSSAAVACHTPPQNLPPAAFLGKSNTGVHISRWGASSGRALAQTPHRAGIHGEHATLSLRFHGHSVEWRLLRLAAVHALCQLAHACVLGLTSVDSGPQGVRCVGFLGWGREALGYCGLEATSSTGRTTFGPVSLAVNPSLAPCLRLPTHLQAELLGPEPLRPPPLPVLLVSS